jgi:hypothetical protein
MVEIIGIDESVNLVDLFNNIEVAIVNSLDEADFDFTSVEVIYTSEAYDQAFGATITKENEVGQIFVVPMQDKSGSTWNIYLKQVGYEYPVYLDMSLV